MARDFLSSSWTLTSTADLLLWILWIVFIIINVLDSFRLILTKQGLRLGVKWMINNYGPEDEPRIVEPVADEPTPDEPTESVPLDPQENLT